MCVTVCRRGWAKDEGSVSDMFQQSEIQRYTILGEKNGAHMSRAFGQKARGDCRPALQVWSRDVAQNAAYHFGSPRRLEPIDLPNQSKTENHPKDRETNRPLNRTDLPSTNQITDQRRSLTYNSVWESPKREEDEALLPCRLPTPCRAGRPPCSWHERHDRPYPQR